ncbi:MAG: response regulator [Deltaproteobacteria bacterium]|nr:response regulator [Deltaproteobacteria bacterium]MBW1963039.1 response regulator [Deltaproteobacteria bacterium]MBW1992956.1 response regulator [Deltaproteobacteria bacterium]MBW2152842.1 response regulator [Deltaproteobacteria bacterium]
MTGLEDWKVVLIDDEEDIRDIMTIALEDAGYEVHTAHNGESGIQKTVEISPQIVITDIRMPGMNGIQVLEAIKKHNPDIEVIVATAFGEMSLAIRALQLDASDFITKPINDETLHLALKRAKERYTSRKQLKDYTALLEREKAETVQELIKTYTFQKNLIESSMDGILGCDENETIVIFNRSMEQMLGYSKQEVLNKMTLDRFFLPGEKDRLKQELAGERYGGKNRLLLFETTLVGSSDKTIPVQVSATAPLNQDQGGGLVFFFRDLREIRKLEREVSDQARILHQDKMMSLGKLAASMVHEINNPLSGILNYIRLMIRILSTGQLSEDRRKKFLDYLKLMENETHRCSKIVSSLLTFSRKSPPSFGQVRIDELLERCVILSQHKLQLQNIQLISDTEPNIPPVIGDFNQLQQCVINLIFNAIDAMPEGGKLYLSAAYDASKKQVMISVKDTGAGIPPKNLPHIFEPFFTTKQEGYGVGLGLSTVYGIMERHGGSVDVESKPGDGATFRLRIPVE